MILAGDYVVQGPGEAPLKDAAVVLDGEKVSAVGPLSEIRRRHPGKQVIGGAGHAVIPGLIDAHQHGRGVTNIQRGVPDGPLEQWLIRLRGLWPADPYLTTMLAAVRLLRTGVTTAMHHFASTGVLPFEAETEAALRAYDDAGIRVTFTLDFRDCNYYVYASDEEFLAGLPAELGREVREKLPPRVLPKPVEVVGMLPELRKKWASTRLLLALGPQGVEWSSDASLREVAAFARAEGLPIHTHALETRRQRDASLRTFGASPVARMEKLGLLGEKTSLAHMVWASDADLDVVKDRGAVIVHNPASNLRLRSGIAPVLSMLRKAIPVGIGMDGMSLSDQTDFFQDLRLCRHLHFDAQGALDPDDVWRMVYSGGARATFWGEQVGSLKPGCWGDALLIRLSQDDRVAPMDPVWRVTDRVLREGHPAAIAAVVVGGRVVVKDGACTMVDEAGLLDKVRAHARSADAGAVAARRALVARLEGAVESYYLERERAST
jgi:cytosine/adenosine deaminase-related metal-dependent hydrolase